VAFYQLSSLIGMALRQTYIYCLRSCICYATILKLAATQ